MGQNRRYGTDVTQAAINAAVTRPEPISLIPAERGTDTRTGNPIPVTAWVRFPETPVNVEATAIEWTDRAVLVEFTMHDGRTRRAWVWACAVERRDTPSK